MGTPRQPIRTRNAVARHRGLMRAGGFAFAVAMERRSIARGSDRIRHVDLSTGTAPTLRQTILLIGAREAIKESFNRLAPMPGMAKQKRHASELQDILQRARREHPDDPQARNEAIDRVFRERAAAGGGRAPGVSLVPLVSRVVLGVAIQRLPIPFLRERRTLADLVAGTKLAPRAPSRWTRLLRRRRAF